MKSPACSICARLEAVRDERHPRFIAELETGVVCLGDHQLYPGYCLFLSKEHARELPDLSDERCRLFLWEMSRLAQSILYVCRPRKLNYEMLGNQDAHLHWHLFPRYPDDPSPLSPVWGDVNKHLQAQPPAELGIDASLEASDLDMKKRILYHLRQSGVTLVRAF